MKVSLKKPLKLLGTRLEWPSHVPLDAIEATNQPDWEEEGKVFVQHPTQPDASLLVTSDDYERADHVSGPEIRKRAPIRTASDLKHWHLLNYPDSKFFTRNNMRFAGDTMSNYRVRRDTVLVKTFRGDVHECYVLERRKPVKCDLQSDTYFDSTTFKLIHGNPYLA